MLTYWVALLAILGKICHGYKNPDSLEMCKSFSKLSCTDSSNRPCYLMDCELDETQKIVLEVEPTNHYKLDCYNSLIEYGNLPRPILENQEGYLKEGFRINMCPLDDTPFAEILQSQGIKSSPKLQLWNSDYSTLQKRHLYGLNKFNVTELEIYNSSVQNITVNLFEDMNNLKLLKLENVKFLPPKGAFDALINLEELQIIENDMEKLPDGMFSKLINLRSLSLGSNTFILQKSTLEGLDSLKTLYLSENRIKTISHDVFELVPALEELTLDENTLITLPHSLLRNNKFLKIITLTDNESELKEIPDMFLCNLGMLKEVVLVGNGIEIIPANMFTNSSNINYINLERNSIAVLPEHIFSTQHNLKILSLKENRINNIPARVFENLRNLEVLNMDLNCIENIPENMFKGLDMLENLTLHGNRLKYISDFPSMAKLQMIDMSNNKLAWDSLNGFVPVSPFQHLGSLRELILHSNRISAICLDWRMGLQNLRKLNLSYNLFTAINDFNEIQFNKHNEFTLDLRNNNITSLLALPLTEETYLPRHNINILIENNPFECDCHLLNFIFYLNAPKHFISFNFEMTDNVTCRKPGKLKDTRIASIKPEELICEYYNDGSCAYSKKTYDHTRMIICANGAIDASYVFSDLDNEENYLWNQTELHLENNNLQVLPKFRNTLNKHIKLHLRGNKLDGLENGFTTSHIELLDLRSNNITYIDEYEAERILNSSILQEFYISDNPIACDCLNQPFLSKLELYKEKVKDYTSLKCINGSFVAELRLGYICQNNNSFWIPLVSTIVPFLIVTALIWYWIHQYYKNDRIKIWLSENWKWTNEYIRPHTLDISNMRYDVFVCAAYKDDGIVTNDLIHKMERDDFRICYHQENWIGGNLIIENIRLSIEQSQVVVFFLTENFLESNYGSHEFDVALNYHLNGKCNIVVIKHGAIISLDKRPMIKLYTEKYTYLEWDKDNEMFWKRYYLSLPRKLCELKKIYENCKPEIRDVKIEQENNGLKELNKHDIIKANTNLNNFSGKHIVSLNNYNNIKELSNSEDGNERAKQDEYIAFLDRPISLNYDDCS